MVSGYTDYRGADKHNHELSNRRVEAVVNVLTSLNSSISERIITQTHGESNLLLEEPGVFANGINRRVMINLVTRGNGGGQSSWLPVWQWEESLEGNYGQYANGDPL